MRLRHLKKFIVIMVIAFLLTVSLGGCAPAAAVWDGVQRLFGGKPPISSEPSETDVNGSETSGNSGETSIDESTETIPTTSEPEGEELVRVSRKLDPLLWEVGEKLYYIDLNTRTLLCRFDVEQDKEDEGVSAAPASTTELTDQVDTIIGFKSS